MPVSGVHEVEWDKAFHLSDFTFPWNRGRKEDMVFSALWDGISFFFRFEVNNPTPKISDDTSALEVVQSERVEMFFRQDQDMTPYYCLEIDTNARLLDYKAMYHRAFDFSWCWPHGELSIESVPVDKGYIIQGQLSVSSLKQLGLWNDGCMEIGLFRANSLGYHNGQIQFDWSSWVTPDSTSPDFHIPATFGQFVFS